MRARYSLTAGCEVSIGMFSIMSWLFAAHARGGVLVYAQDRGGRVEGELLHGEAEVEVAPTLVEGEDRV